MLRTGFVPPCHALHPEPCDHSIRQGPSVSLRGNILMEIPISRASRSRASAECPAATWAVVSFYQGSVELGGNVLVLGWVMGP